VLKLNPDRVALFKLTTLAAGVSPLSIVRLRLPLNQFVTEVFYLFNLKKTKILNQIGINGILIDPMDTKEVEDFFNE
jgi:hypothetical protein